MPRGVRKNINYDEEIQKIDKQIHALKEKRTTLLSRKTEREMKSLTEFIMQNNMTAADAIAILTPAVAASAQKNAATEV